MEHASKVRGQLHIDNQQQQDNQDQQESVIQLLPLRWTKPLTYKRLKLS